MKYCKSCGAALLDGFRFCVQCGATIEPDQPEEAASEPAAADPPAAPAQPHSMSGMPEYIPEYSAEPAAAAEPVAPAFTEPKLTEPAFAEPVQPVVPRPDEPALYSNPLPTLEPQIPANNGTNGLLGFDGAFVALLLFCLPVVGLITAIIWALGGAKNASRKNLARAYLLLVLAVCLFGGCMALLVWLIAGDQMREFFDLLRSWFQAQAAILPCVL